MKLNPFKWLLRATSHNTNGINVYKSLISIGRMWQEEECKFICNAKKPFTYTDLDGNRNCTLIPPCADHVRYVDIDGECACVMEPYQKSMESIEELVSFCKKHGMTFSIDGESSHFPGGCMRIIVKKQME